MSGYLKHQENNDQTMNDANDCFDYFLGLFCPWWEMLTKWLHFIIFISIKIRIFWHKSKG